MYTKCLCISRKHKDEKKKKNNAGVISGIRDVDCVLGGTAGRRNFRCGGLHLFRGKCVFPGLRLSRPGPNSAKASLRKSPNRNRSSHSIGEAAIWPPLFFDHIVASASRRGSVQTLAGCRAHSDGAFGAQGHISYFQSRGRSGRGTLGGIGVGKWWTFSRGMGMMGGSFGKLQHQRTDPSENRWHLGCDRLRCADDLSAAGECFSFACGSGPSSDGGFSQAGRTRLDRFGP